MSAGSDLIAAVKNVFKTDEWNVIAPALATFINNTKANPTDGVNDAVQFNLFGATVLAGQHQVVQDEINTFLAQVQALAAKASAKTA